WATAAASTAARKTPATPRTHANLAATVTPVHYPVCHPGERLVAAFYPCRGLCQRMSVLAAVAAPPRQSHAAQISRAISRANDQCSMKFSHHGLYVPWTVKSENGRSTKGASHQMRPTMLSSRRWTKPLNEKIVASAAPERPVRPNPSQTTDATSNVPHRMGKW